jgi:hypothetical protein
MEAESRTVTYFAEPGPQNTEATLREALRRAKELGVEHVVVASDTGKTAEETLRAFGSGFRVVVVTNPPGVALPVSKLHDYLPRFREHRQALEASGVQKVPCSLSEEKVAALREAGATVLRVDWKRVSAYARSDLRAIDRIGVGVRVALSVALCARLADVVPAGADLIGIAGTGFGGGGADTAIVVRTAAAWRDWRVLETIVRPRESPPSE